MMTVNVYKSVGLDNGSTGVLRDIGFSTSNTPNILWIQFLDESIGDSGRSKCSHRQEPSWTPVVKIVKSFQINSSQATTIDRKQSQGGTYSKVVVHTSPGHKCSRSFYHWTFRAFDPLRTQLQKKSSENCVPLSY